MGFKESMSNVKAKVSDKWNKIDEKYPWAKWVLFGSGVIITGGLITYISNKVDNELNSIVIPAPEYTASSKNNSNNYLDSVSNHCHDPIKETSIKLDNDEKIYLDPAESESTGSLKEIWDKYYKDNWDEVVECVKRLNLAPGEMFIIEDPTQFENTNEPVISHLVNNYGVYPPEE